MTLEKTDVELIERIIYKNSDDIAVSIARSFERLEERIDSSESRLHTRLAQLEDKVEGTRREVTAGFEEITDLGEELLED